jgi:hypothetical protein
MVVDLPRRWRWTIVGACAVVVALGLVFVGLTRLEGGAASAATPAIARAAAVAPRNAVARPDPPEPAASAAERHASDEVQVCGGAWVRTEPDGSFDRAEFERATGLPRQRERVLAALRSSPSELARAAALLLAAADTAEPAAPPARVADPLARIALASTDPRVYALAFKACGGLRERGEGACRMLSAEQWARLDPDNAAPWRFIHAAASARGDLAAQEEALFRLARARRSASGFFDVAGTVLAVMPGDEAALLAASTLVTEAIAIEAAVALPSMQPLVQACRGAALRDPNRAQTCGLLAEALTERADTLLDRMIGVAVGREIGWSVQRTDRMRGEYTAYLASLTDSGAPVRNAESLGCARIRRDLDRLRRTAALGEVGAMREWVTASGKPARVDPVR